MKPVYFTRHSRESMRKRGVSEDEVREAISRAPWQPSRWGKLECTLEFEYNQEWHGKFYRRKQVIPIFVEEDTRIVVVTVYAFYF